jgi:chromosome segregation ATPase
MFYALHILAAAVGEVSPAADVVSLVITSVVSATVFSAIITGLVQYLINRRNSRITERKNTLDAESDVVNRYKDQAREEREGKESAVRVIQELLGESKEQIAALKSTVETLNGTIALMKDVNAAQGDIISQLTNDRDRTQAALERAEARILAQKEQLRLKQQEIAVLIDKAREREEAAAKIVTGTFVIGQDEVE